MNEQQLTQITRQALADSTRIPISIRVVGAWILASAVLLARRHPGLHKPLKRELRDIQHLFEAAISDRHPDTKGVLENVHDQTRFIEATQASMGDQEPVVCTLKARQIWLLVSALQLATRHPQVPNREEIIFLGRQFQVALTEHNPVVREVLEMGWDQRYDR